MSQAHVADRTYRTDIDGLRAIAILSVVAYHAGVRALSGGFTGVDVFFVISGYLIGGHIFSELRSGSFSFLRFYQRRAKRILPAYYFVLLFTVAAALVLLSPYEAAQFGRSAFAATLSASNVLFWKTTGYFDLRSELNPLLMTWSLGVEEQFYAIIPLLLLLLYKVRRSWLLPAILLGCAVSFAFAVRELSVHPTMVFYMLPSRAWELGIGVALAVTERGKSISLRPAMAFSAGLVGLAMILMPAVYLTVATPFPGVAALPSVLGTAMLLAVPGNWINQRLLSLRPLVFVGKISYSFYLWHWPLLALARVVYGREVPPAAVAFVIVLSFAASIFSYHFVEQPFRKSTAAPVPLLVRYGVVSAVILAVCAGVWKSGGVPQRDRQLAQMENAGLTLTGDPCLAPYGKDKPNLSGDCVSTSTSGNDVALWGDSHSAALAPGLRAIANQEGYGFLQLSKASCPPLTGATRFILEHPGHAAECQRFNQRVLQMLKSDAHVRTVVLAGYWGAPFLQDLADGWLTPDLVHEHTVPNLDATTQLMEQSLSASIRDLRQAGKDVVVMNDVPVFDVDPLWRIRTSRLPVRHELTGLLQVSENDDPGFAQPIGASASAMATSALQHTAGEFSSGVALVDLTPRLCSDAHACVYRQGNELFYTDTQHLSLNGAKYALRDFRFTAGAEPNTEALAGIHEKHKTL